MTTHTESNPTAETTETSTLAALILELDGVALDTRTILCKAATSALSKAGKKLNPGLFSRYGQHASAASLARNLVEKLDVSGLSAEDLAESLSQSLETYLSKDAKLNAHVEKLIKAAQQRDLPVAVITALPEALAHATVERLGLTASHVRLFTFTDEEQGGFPRADVWLKVAKALGKNARFCVAVTSSQVSAKSALSAGMRCVVAPDSFTSHQDFGGTDVILDTWEDLSANDVLDAVVPMVR